MKRFLALVLTLVLIVSLCCSIAFAAGSPNEVNPGKSPNTGISGSLCIALGVAAVSGTSAIAVARKKD